MITASAMKGLKKNPFSYLLKVLDKNIDHNLLSAAGLPLVYGIVAVTMMRYNNNSIIRY